MCLLRLDGMFPAVTFSGNRANDGQRADPVIDAFDTLSNTLCLLRLDDMLPAVTSSGNKADDRQHAGTSVPKV